MKQVIDRGDYYQLRKNAEKIVRTLFPDVPLYEHYATGWTIILKSDLEKFRSCYD